VTDPTQDEIDLIRRLEDHGGEVTLQGNIDLLKIGRLIPEYVTTQSPGMDTVVFTLTEKGWELAHAIERKYPRDAEPRR
jgi:hypothetical protein